MKLSDQTKAIQNFLGVPADGIYGPNTASAIMLALKLTTPAETEWREGKASSFADPADVAAFRRCKLEGKSDQECFKVGDNGIGKWGDDTTQDTPMCALPPEDWEPMDRPRGKLVIVRANGHEVVCELRDTMPHRANIKNGAIIDLNPAAVAALGLQPPIMVSAQWRWA